ncbi:MAG: hypothetical protein OEY14_13700 [Myxococcales bacterium]|nr:hypothetical protein [Myxococcales bacterium]
MTKQHSECSLILGEVVGRSHSADGARKQAFEKLGDQFTAEAIHAGVKVEKFWPEPLAPQPVFAFRLPTDRYLLELDGMQIVVRRQEAERFLPVKGIHYNATTGEWEADSVVDLDDRKERATDRIAATIKELADRST